MEWLSRIDWGSALLGLLGLGFVWLLAMAVRRMLSRPRALEAPEEGGPEELPAPGRGRAEAVEPAERDEARRAMARGLARTRGGFVARLSQLFGSRATFDEAMLEQVEEVLYTADIGVATSHLLIESIRRELKKEQQTNAAEVWKHLKERSAEMIHADGADLAAPFDLDRGKPFVLLVVGVNGTGKTTTIGKLAALLRRDGYSVLLAAGDTFRAAAAEQLAVWAGRSETPIVQGKEGSDPTAVIVEAVKRAKSEGIDVVIADTAGRLQTKVSLMDELQKISRSIGRQLEGAPHETWIVLDATTGQNAISQAKTFKEAIAVTGIVLTKLDGTAKGGVVLGICNELKLPIRFIGVGEQIEDLRAFEADAFIEALYARDPDSNGAGEAFS